MSQDKVNRYKANKQSRKKAVNQAKRTDFYINLFLITVTVVIVAFIAWSVYAEFFRKTEPAKTVNKLTAGEIEKIIDRHTDADDSDDSESDDDSESETSSESESVSENETSSETGAVSESGTSAESVE